LIPALTRSARPSEPQAREERPIFTTAPLRDRVRIVADKRPAAPTVVEATGISDGGRQRSANQDRWAADAVLGLYLVADGMGGTAHGELAAQMVVEMLPVILRKELRGLRDLGDPRAIDRARTALIQLNRAVWLESQQDPSLVGMGSTVVFAQVWEGHALIGHLGDSRAYLFRNGSMEQLTQDHSVEQRMLQRGELTPGQASDRRLSGRLTRFAGMAGEARPDIRQVPLAPGDQLLLCSNGLWEMVRVAEMEAVLRLGWPLQESCRLLVDAANVAGGADTVAVLLIAPLQPAASRCGPRPTPEVGGRALAG
jgi:protein phosphatase